MIARKRGAAALLPRPAVPSPTPPQRPPPATTSWRAAAPAGEAVPLAAASPGASAGTPGSAAPDGPGAAPCAGGAWPAGALATPGAVNAAGGGLVSAAAGRVRHAYGASRHAVRCAHSTRDARQRSSRRTGQRSTGVGVGFQSTGLCGAGLPPPRAGLPGTASSPPWWGQKRSIGRCAFAPTSAPQGAGNSTGCAALRPCRGTNPSPARRNESVAGSTAHAVKAKPSATLRVARQRHARQP